MQHLSTAFVITALVIVVCHSGGVTANDEDDLMAVESRHPDVSVISGPEPKETTSSTTSAPPETNNNGPPIEIIHGKRIYVDPPRHHGPPTKTVTLRHVASNKIYKVVSLYKNHGVNRYYVKAPSQPPSRLVYSASSGRPVIAKSPKFSVPVQTINGIPADVVRPPKIALRDILNTTTTTTTTTTEPTTTTRALRTKRIWPKHLQEKMNALLGNRSQTYNVTANEVVNSEKVDNQGSASRVVYVVENSASPAPPSSTPRVYRRVTRAPRPPPTAAPTADSQTPAKTNSFQLNEWVPIVPHYPKCPGGKRPHKISRRSDSYFPEEPEPSPTYNRKLMLVRPYAGGYPMASDQAPIVEPIGRKKMVFFRKQNRLNPLLYSNINPKHVQVPSTYLMHDMQSDASQNRPKVVTKVKHHHHHHHHRYVQTVEKPVQVPFKVEVPKPYPVPVEKKVEVPVEKIKIVEKRVPYPVTVEKKVPVPYGMRIPYPVPVKVVEKEYVPRPYPVVHRVPVYKEVRVPQPVPVEVERRVPYPVQVQVPVHVDKPVPVPVTVEKKVPYPVPVKVLVPRPYPVEKKIPVPYEVKEPYEVIKHVPVRVPVPQPYPVKVPHPVPVPFERKVPYPVEVEKKVPVPIEILVPQKVEVEKRVPVYVPQPYPVEKKVPYPVRVPYPMQTSPYDLPAVVNNDLNDPYSIYKGLDDSLDGNLSQSAKLNSPQQYFGAGSAGSFGFSGFQSRVDDSSPDDTVTTTTTESSSKP